MEMLKREMQSVGRCLALRGKGMVLIHMKEDFMSSIFRPSRGNEGTLGARGHIKGVRAHF